jgi:hypothetical protein
MTNTDRHRHLGRRSVLAGLFWAGAAGAGVALPARNDPAVGTGRVQRQPGAPGPLGDDTALLNALFAGGGEVQVPGREYSVSVDDRGACLVVDRPGTHVSFAPGAVIRLKPSSLPGYVVLAVNAPDCSITGGLVVGDVRRHAGTEGEWGHGVALGAGADRCTLTGVTSTECWGDGFFVAGAVTDVRLDGCVAADNRRQGLSVVDAVRPRITEGRYGGTGRFGQTVPASGIDLEPNLDGAVVGAVLERVALSGNRGHGLLVSARHGPVEASVTACTAARNGDAGILVDGPGAAVLVTDCTATANARGMASSPDVRGLVGTRVVATASTGVGFDVDGTGNRLVECAAAANGGSGFLVRPTAVDTVLDRCEGAGNSSHAVVPDFDVAGPGTRVVGARSRAGSGRPSSALVLRETATGASVADGTWVGPYAITDFQDQRGSVG